MARDRPFSTAKLIAMRWGPLPEERDLGTGAGNTDPGGQFSKEQIERFRCASAGNPAAAVDISCNTTEYNQDWNLTTRSPWPSTPPTPTTSWPAPTTTSTGSTTPPGPARRSCRPGSSSFGGGPLDDGQIPMRTGNGARDLAGVRPPPRVALMAQLENTGGLGGPFVAQGNVSVSRSPTAASPGEPITVFKGQGAGIGPANNAVFYDKEWLTVDNSPGSPHAVGPI